MEDNRSSSSSHQHMETWVWVASQLVDYGGCLCLCFSQTMWGIPWIARLWISRGVPLPVNIIKLMALQGVVAILILYIREQLHFFLLGSRVAPDKNKPLTSANWYQVFRCITWAQIWISFLESQNWFYRPTDFLSAGFWISAYSQFYAMVILRDIFLMHPFHRLFHQNKTLYRIFHKTHHQVTKGSQGMHAFHIDLVDLLLENLGAYSLLLMAQYLTGRSELGIHWFSLSALLAHDVALHSVNPHSSNYFNPVLDYFLKPNVCHQLHHAWCTDEDDHEKSGHILCIPLQHLDSKKRKADMDKYNKIFKTDFFE